MKYSFIIPIYNVENYLDRCLESVLTQTYTDFEVILIDDGSTDSSGLIAETYAQNYPEKICVIHQENAGQGEARNKGILKAEGTYLLMVDSDDYISQELLETVDRYIEKYDDDILIFNFIMEEPDGKQEIKKLHDVTKHTWISSEKYIFEAPAPWNKVIRTSLFQETELCFPKRIFYEDLATIPCLAIYAKRIGVVEDALYYYVQRESSTMHTPDIQRMTEICTALEKVLNYFKSKGKFEAYYQELEYLTVSNVLCSTVQRILEVKYKYGKIRSLEQYTEKNSPGYRSNKYVKKYINRKGCRRERWIIEKRYFILWVEYFLRKMKKNCLRGFK